MEQDLQQNTKFNWSPAEMLEITLNEPNDFLKVKETLTLGGI